MVRKLVDLVNYIAFTLSALARFPGVTPRALRKAAVKAEAPASLCRRIWSFKFCTPVPRSARIREAINRYG